MTEEMMRIDGPAKVAGTLPWGTVMFQSGGDFIVKFGPDGAVEFGEKYRGNPDEAAKAFIDCVLKHWPGLRASSELGARFDRLQEAAAKHIEEWV